MTEYWVFVFVIALIPLLVARNFFGRELETWEGYVSVGIAVSIWMLSTYILVKRYRKYRLEDNEWVTFYTYSILNNLEKHSKTSNIEMKKDFIKKATKNAKDFLSYIKKRWKIAKFKLARDLFGKPLSELKKNVEYRIIPSLEKGDNKSLGEVEQIIWNFHAKSRMNFNLKTINYVNEQMSSRLESTEKMEIGLRSGLTNFFSAHKIVKHELFVSVLTIGCCAFYYIVTTHLEIPKEYAFTGSVAIFLGLLTIYFRQQPKE